MFQFCRKDWVENGSLGVVRVGTRLMWSRPHTRGLPVALQLGVAVCLAAWIGLLPVSQFFHYAFASHDHRYCNDHQQFEDLPRTASPIGRDGLLDGSFEPSSGLSQGSTTGPQQHLACPFLNGGSSLKFQERADARSTRSARVACLQAERERFAPPPSIPLLLRAPKTPPPCTAS
jgi:hypothetical protein